AEAAVRLPVREQWARVGAVSPSSAGAASLMITVAQIEGMDRAAFVHAFGGVFEHSPWVAEQAWAARPFPDVTALHVAMCAAVRGASRPRQLALLAAHPDLAGRAARAGAMSAASVAEPASAAPEPPTPDQDARL